MTTYKKSNILNSYVSDLVSALENKSKVRITLVYDDGYYYKVEVISEREVEQFPIFLNQTVYQIVYKLISPNSKPMVYNKWSFNKLKCTSNIVEIKRMSRLKLLFKRQATNSNLIAIL